MNDFIFIKQNQSKQYIGQDSLYMNNYIEPFINFSSLLSLYYANVYHRRAIRLKASLLSQIDTTLLKNHLPLEVTPKDFLYAFVHNLEIYGNAPIEKSGTKNVYQIYNIPCIEFVIDKNRQIYQRVGSKLTKLDGYILKYYSPSSRFYGEPDYLATLLQISTTYKADKYNDNFFDNNARPDLAIIYENGEPNKEQIDAFREFFGSNFKGYDNAHKAIILHASDGIGEKDVKIKIQELGAIKDLSFKELKAVNRDEIAVAHGVPPRLLGILHSGSLGGGGELIGQLHQFNETEIKPKIQTIEDFFNSIGISLKLKPLDVTNFKDDADVVTNLVQSGIININEARSILGWQKNI